MAVPTLATAIPRGTDIGFQLSQGVISGQSPTRTLLPSESNATCLFDNAAGVIYTLPPCALNLRYNFLTTVTITSNSSKVITNAATEFLVGGVALLNNAAATGEAFSANGTTIRSINGNGTTTGGIIGDFYSVVGLSSTQWGIEGTMIQSGTASTPFATS